MKFTYWGLSTNPPLHNAPTKKTFVGTIIEMQIVTDGNVNEQYL